MRTYSARNSDKKEYQAVMNAYQNAVNEDMKAAMFTSEVYYPNFFEKVLSKTFSIKWWGEGVRNIELIKSNLYSKDEKEKFSTKSQEESIAVAFASFILQCAGVSDTDLATELVNIVFGETTTGKIATTAIKLFSLGRDVKDIYQISKEDLTSEVRIGLDYLDMVFLMDPQEAKRYFDSFKLVQSFMSNRLYSNKSIKYFGLQDAAIGMLNTITTRKWVDPLEMKELGVVMTRVGGQMIKLTLKLASIAITISGLWKERY